jgi:hypothetical protein
MAKGSDKRPPIGRFGGVRLVQRRIGRSETLYANKEMVATELLNIGTTRITDIVNLDGSVKDIDEIPEEALSAIKRISAGPDGRVTIELFDKVGVLRVLAKASGLLDAEANQEKPSIIGINMRGPELIEDVDPVTTYEEIGGVKEAEAQPVGGDVEAAGEPDGENEA